MPSQNLNTEVLDSITSELATGEALLDVLDAIPMPEEAPESTDSLLRSHDLQTCPLLEVVEQTRSSNNLGRVSLRKLGWLSELEIPLIKSLDLRPPREIFVTRPNILGEGTPGQLAIAGLASARQARVLVPPDC